MAKRLIDANALITRIQGTASEVARLSPYDVEWFSRMAQRQSEIVNIIVEAPTVDAVEVIRCRDCKYHRWEQELCHGRIKHFCSNPKGLTVVRKDTFCSYGERRTDE